MLLSAVVICCMIVANAESPLNGYSFTGTDGNAYDYGNTVTSNGYLGSKDSYQNGGSFYGAGDANQKLSNYVGSHSLINGGNQAGTGGSDVGNSYNGYSANGNEYAGYSNTYEKSVSESYTTPARATSIPHRGYIGSNNAESTFNAYSSDLVNKDPDFGQYAASSSSSSSSSSKRIPAYPGYLRPTRVSDNYPEASTDIGVQGYRGPSGSSSYSESDHAYAPYSQSGLTSEYLFGKQKNDPLNLKGGNKYSGVYSIPSETRFTRGNSGHVSYNRDVPSFMSGLISHISKTHGIHSSVKPSKYGSKYLSRYAPNNDVTYLSRDRDGYYMPYSKGGGKVIVIKNNSPSYANRVYSDEPLYASSIGGYRSKSGFATSYSASPFDGYTGSSSYDDGPAIIRRYRSGPMLVQRPIYA
ncbi:prisilkin-39 [Solenopsis invicta]|uniref:prisilkin-39 n=1 Tax=Solenopsis invicta TaxID=13686 RepID=UPI00193CE415|nr:prisilkin-39 [Solenopsis invicta]